VEIDGGGLEGFVAQPEGDDGGSTPACRRVMAAVCLLRGIPRNRHTAAMRLLHAGIDPSVIALWLGHAEIQTTQIYLHADLALKEAALAKAAPIHSKPGRYRPPDKLLAFLEAL
jgi:integrase